MRLAFKKGEAMKHLLVVDDSAIIRKIARRVGEADGLRVSEAESCVEAADLCERDMPDVILLDRAIEGAPAVEFVTKLREAHGTEHPKVIYCSIENDPIYVAMSLRHGVNDYIVKPFELDAIREKLNRALSA